MYSVFAAVFAINSRPVHLFLQSHPSVTENTNKLKHKINKGWDDFEKVEYQLFYLTGITEFLYQNGNGPLL